MIRDIVEIDEKKCDGCGQCVPSCAEGALYLEGGKVHLRDDALCDGLGACLGDCPKDALRVVKRDVAAFDEQAARVGPPARQARAVMRMVSPGGDEGCPGSRPRALHTVTSDRPAGADAASRPRLAVVSDAPPPLVPVGGSRLRQWPVQIHLVSPGAPYLRGVDLLVAADCVPFAYARFHEDFLEGRRLLVGCPKLDDLAAYAEKLTEIFRQAGPRSVTVVKMEVPCCNGIAAIVRQALSRAGAKAPLEVVTVGIPGAIVHRA